MISPRSIAVQGVGFTALAIAVQGLTSVVTPGPEPSAPSGIYGAPHVRTSSLAQIASNPWRDAELLEHAHREDDELLQIVEELVRHLQ